ncbi:hypothetical protein CORC01_03450 [Colletotrichum orchidophilum]|uniref:Uncharacterized protein n=1 Tax=Colletotrichum orchidophilum TaxID=1209926 RepID=A0A1G4BIK9_9PEZI|nr:uncharacterized protein CORC01_03450 [Colletotrichum orchidophilum]OHF01136.1 hypothetical protein CORC01_03450 [Colletotrichum orchidophilum]
MMRANPGYSPQGGFEPIPSSMFALAVLTEEQEEGYHVLLDTDRYIIILVRVGDEFPRGWPPVQPDADHEEWIGDDENEAGDEDKDESDGEHTDDEVDLYLCGHDWREMPAYRIDTFFKMCREQRRVMNWMPKMEWAGQTHEEYTFTESECDTDCGTGLRRRITREAGWPGTDNEVGLGWDKAKAEKEMIELM